MAAVHRWNPIPVLERLLKSVQNRAVAAIRSAKPLAKGGSPGGSLPSRAASADILQTRKASVTLRWDKLGQEFLWFNRGTLHQPARPVPLSPADAEVDKAVSDDAARHFEEQEARRERRRGRR